MTIGYTPGTHRNNNVSCFLAQHALGQPDRVALYCSNTPVMTYGELDQKASALGYGLREQGVNAGDRVIVFLTMTPALYLSIAGLQRIGAIPVLIDGGTSKEQIDRIVRNAKPIGIITASEALPLFSRFFPNDLRFLICTTPEAPHGQRFEDLMNGGTHDIMAVVQEQTALITYTTGSSGAPKGANRTHRFLAAQHYALKRLFPYNETDVDLPVFPVFTLNSIASGIPTVLPAVDTTPLTNHGVATLLSQMNRFGVNCMTLSPSAFRAITDYCKTHGMTLPALRRVLTGGAPISETDIARFITIAPNAESWILYGSTEVEPIATIESREMLAMAPLPPTGNITRHGVNVGKIDPQLESAYIPVNANIDGDAVDMDQIKVKDGAVGELIVTGEHVCRGYYNDPTAFARTKIVDRHGRIWHRTGDLARRDDRGYCWIVGRLYNIVERNGEYFFPVRPEIILKDLPRVRSAAYVSVPLHGNTTIVAAVTLDDANREDGVSPEVIHQTIATAFEHAHIPLDRVVVLEDIPMDVRHHSKVDYALLRQKLHALLA